MVSDPRFPLHVLVRGPVVTPVRHQARSVSPRPAGAAPDVPGQQDAPHCCASGAEASWGAYGYSHPSALRAASSILVAISASVRARSRSISAASRRFLRASSALARRTPWISEIAAADRPQNGHGWPSLTGIRTLEEYAPQPGHSILSLIAAHPTARTPARALPQP